MMRPIQCTILLLLGGFFIAAGGLKLLDPYAFHLSILRYRIVGPDLAWVAALFLPWLEVFCGAALWLRVWRGAATWILVLLLCFFEVILASAYFRGLDIDCGCLGSGGLASSVGFAFVRNLLLIGVFVLIARMERSKT